MFQTYYSHDANDNHENAVILPTNAVWYGGARFDSGNDTTTMHHEWSDFDQASSSKGSAYWMLPAVELLVKHHSPNDENARYATTTATLAVHIVATNDTNFDWNLAVQPVYRLLQALTAECANTIPPTTLPPILERGHASTTTMTKRPHDSNNNEDDIVYRKDDQECYEEAVAQALKELQPPASLDPDPPTFRNDTLFVMDPTVEPPLEKVVLARKQCLHFGTTLTALDVIRRWKYGGHEGGHLFYIRPGRRTTTTNNGGDDDNNYQHSEFFGCTPERLFSVQGPSGLVQSEALAGTRPRGSTQPEDDRLLHELLESPKDRRENRLTGRYIEQAFDELHDAGFITKWNENCTVNDDVTKLTEAPSFGVDASSSGYFVRRLLHLQHLCQRYSAKIYDPDQAMTIARALLQRLHPTPAVCGVPMERALQFIRQHESTGFDRGYYSGPVGYIGHRETDILVALRCGLATTSDKGKTTVATYAGAGLVCGSTLQGEWAETNYKFAVVSSLFPQSPTALRGAPTANVAWSTAFVSELIRNGITRFYICPGSRSTPLVAAIAKAVRQNIGVVHAISVHDERAAGFRAVGYVRGTGNLCAVLTSSGTAVANLYPAIIEAAMDGLPLLVLTADRPYESRAIGANQAIDQVKTFSESYIRWFRDILPPSDEVPVSIALSDACHGIHLARELRGPVHINVQFRENLAPDSGPIRGDSRVNSITKFSGIRFTDVPGFERWSTIGDAWSKSYARSIKLGSHDAIQDVANLIAQSKRGIIVVGNIRLSVDGYSDQCTVEETISDFARTIGFPVFAGVQNANLRFKSSAVVLFAEHLLRCSDVADNLQPDFVLQIGAPLLSTAIPDVLMKASKLTKLPYIILHPHSSQERSDPSMIVTHSIHAEIVPFLNGVIDQLSSTGFITKCSSQLAPMVKLGRMLQTEMKRIVFEASASQVNNDETKSSLTEPQIIVALSELFTLGKVDRSLFLSNSMPIRDAEMFFYPLHDSTHDSTPVSITVGSNRGASGIDGIISSALGYSESTVMPTTLLIGDMATLHDIGSFHSVATSALQQNQLTIKKRHALTTIIINNDGGGIFSFLPIAKYGNEVGFDEFFGAPTNSFSYSKGAEAFGLPVSVVNTYDSFCEKYEASLNLNNDTVIEAQVVGRSENVKHHKGIATEVEIYISKALSVAATNDISNRLPVKIYGRGTQGAKNLSNKKIMVLLHGWMGDKLDWHESAKIIEKKLGTDWTIFSIDLPCHGAAPQVLSSQLQTIQSSLCIRDGSTNEIPVGVDIDFMAKSVLRTLETYHFVNKIDAVVGYSLGGRIALAMKRLNEKKSDDEPESSMSDAAMIILGAYPGNVLNDEKSSSNSKARRIRQDEVMASEIVALANKACVRSSDTEAKILLDDFLERWYSNPIWTGLAQRDEVYHKMIHKRSKHLLYRGRDIALVLHSCSPPKSNEEDWKYCSPDKTLFVAGELDSKYKNVGRAMQSMRLAQYQEVAQSSHALLVEAPVPIAEIVAAYLLQNCTVTPTKNIAAEQRRLVPPSSVVQKTSMLRAEPVVNTPLWATSVDGITTIGAIEFERFAINIFDEESRSPVLGSGWGKDSMADASNSMDKRQGLIIQITCSNGLMNGLGEISPLKGLHLETIYDAQFQILELQKALQEVEVDNLPYFEADRILSFDGSLRTAINRFAELAMIDNFLPSVRAGLEMALISLSAQQVSFPIHQAIAIYATNGATKSALNMLPLSGILPRKLPNAWTSTQSVPTRRFKSIKVKVGHQDDEQDKVSILQGFQRIERHLSGRHDGRIRADANRAWNESQVIAFATSLEGLDVHALEKIEYIEEPLQQVNSTNSSSLEWTLAAQVRALERSFLQTNIRYAIDESLADVVISYDGEFESIKGALEAVFNDGPHGCAALILKPSLIGYELSFQIANFAKTELGIAVVLSSSFESGLGLAHTAFLSNAVDKIGNSEIYPHGIGTFTFLESDTITPAFGSYVDDEGMLNVPSLSRAIFGLSLDEMRDTTTFPRLDSSSSSYEPKISDLKTDDDITYEASAATSSSGNEISVAVSLPLSFSAETAWLRFTDLPSMSRWSPWITSVRYEGLEETEWVINVRGIPLKWRATSQLLYVPFLGIQWQSVFGLQNSGVVEFIPDDNLDSTSSCVMHVRMTITPPRLFRPFLKGSLFLEDFLRDRLLKWSLEMFRDVVKADLALERYEQLNSDVVLVSGSAFSAIFSLCLLFRNFRHRKLLLYL